MIVDIYDFDGNLEQHVENIEFFSVRTAEEVFIVKISPDGTGVGIQRAPSVEAWKKRYMIDFDPEHTLTIRHEKPTKPVHPLEAEYQRKKRSDR